MHLARFLIALAFVLVPGPVVSYSGHRIKTRAKGWPAKITGSALLTAVWWWWLVATPLVFLFE